MSKRQHENITANRLVLLHSHQRLWLLPAQVSSLANAAGSCSNSLPGNHIRRGYLRFIDTNYHDDHSRCNFDDRNAAGVAVGRRQSGRPVNGPDPGRRIRRQHPNVPESNQLQCGWIHEAECHKRLDVRCILRGQHCRTAILHFYRGAGLSGKLPSASLCL